MHAPLVNPWNTEYPYYLRETQRPANASHAWWYAARHTSPLNSLDGDWVRGQHKDWFGRDGEGEPAYLKRGNSQDLLDFGAVSYTHLDVYKRQFHHCPWCVHVLTEVFQNSRRVR